MLKEVEISFRDFLNALQTAKLYSTHHPIFREALDKAYASLQDALRQKPEIVIGIVGEELAFEKEIFFELSKLVRPVIAYLKDRGIEKLTFRSGMNKEGLDKFIAFLSLPKTQAKQNSQEFLAASGIKDIFAGKLQEGEGGSLYDNLQMSHIGPMAINEGLLKQLGQMIENVLNGDALDQMAFRFVLNNVVESLSLQHQELLKLATLKKYDPETFSHLVSVSILSMYFASKLGFSKDDTLDLGTAALFHDIGKVYISRNILQKKSRLTDEEFDQIKSHTIMGAQIMLQYVDSLGILPVIISFEHHLKYNLKGYPSLKYPQRPHPNSLLVSICDVYDSFSQRRSYRSDYPPDMTYNVMIRERGQAFHPEMLDKFFSAIGVWPIGSIVALSDERVAVVIEENPEQIFSPKVKIIAPENKGEVIDLTGQGDSLKIKRYLNPWGEAKQYLGLV